MERRAMKHANSRNSLRKYVKMFRPFFSRNGLNQQEVEGDDEYNNNDNNNSEADVDYVKDMKELLTT